MSYQDFIASKVRRPEAVGFDCRTLNSELFEWQARVVRWAVKRGRAALFEECGLGKTIQQLEWARQVHIHTGGDVLIHCPIGVRLQTKQEAERFGIVDVNIVESMQDVTRGISLCNYEKLHKIKPEAFAGVVLDESSILKSYTGATKRQLIESWKNTKYKLACTATPSPNDIMELGNHAEFLGVMPSNEMLSRWFVNDTMKAGGYRLRGHAESEFWAWMATWAVSIEKPSDIGGSDEGFILPELERFDHLVEEPNEAPPGMLFNSYELSATNVHRQKKLTAESRAAKVAELIASEPNETWLIWCDTNYEADELKRQIPDVVDIRGSDKSSQKEQKLMEFSTGEISRLITKPTIAGFGMNWQHCRRVAFVGLSYSYEQFYQAIRRCWRFGQIAPVQCHVISSEGEYAITQTVIGKEKAHRAMFRSMAEAMRGFTEREMSDDLTRDTYVAREEVSIPDWMKGELCKS